MEAPASYTDKRCSWCGTLNSPTDNACSKCAAVLSSLQQPDVSAASGTVGGIAPQTEKNSAPDPVVSAMVDSSFFDRVNDEAMRSLGLGPTFESGQTRAYLVAGCLAVYILISLVGAVVDISQFVRLSNAPAGLSTPTPEVTAGVVMTLLIRIALIGVALLTAVAFLFWIYRAHKNLKALDATDLKYSPGWAIGGFFVPLLNLVRPYQVVAEIWKGSAPGARRSAGADWTYQRTPLFISLWWGSWLISGFLDSLGVFVVFGAAESNQLLVATRYRLSYDIISIASASLAIAVVLAINARQERAYRSNSSLPGAVNPEIESYQL